MPATIWDLAREALPSRVTGWWLEGPYLCHPLNPGWAILELLKYEKRRNFYPALAPNHLEISATHRQIYPRLTPTLGGSTELGVGGWGVGRTFLKGQHLTPAFSPILPLSDFISSVVRGQRPFSPALSLCLPR